MKTKIRFLISMVFLAVFSVAFAQRPTFNKSKDILIAQFDSKPDPDDIHAQAALGSMLLHNDLKGVNYFAVSGAVGKQGGKFIDSRTLFDMAFGKANWTAANVNWQASVTQIKNKVVPILQNGGKVWVQEAGQSNITRDWLVEVLKSVAPNTVKNNVIVVQHSTWNENHTDNFTHKRAANPAILNFVKNNSRYFLLDDGNFPSNSSNPNSNNGPWSTPQYQSNNKTLLTRAKNSPNIKARNLWREADRIIRVGNHLPSYSVITRDGVDYSDCVENWWILGIGNNADNNDKFWNRYVTNTTGINPNPGPGTPTTNPNPTPNPAPCTSKTFEEKNGIVAVEAEAFVKQSKTNDREWFIIGEATNTPKPDPDAAHTNGASGGKYVELLPDTRVTHGDPLVAGVSFSDAPGVAAVLDYNIKFNSAGKYFVWVRAYSTGSEDNGIHVGINGTWPDSGKRMQWCNGKNAWTWESKQRTAANHCGVERQIFINVPSAGTHTISFSMREDGFEMDKFILSKAFNKPNGVGATPVAVNCNNNPNPNPDPTPSPSGQFYVVNRQTGKKLAPQNNNDGAELIQLDASNTSNIAKWTQVNTSNGHFYLKNVSTGKYFRPATDADGSKLEQRPTSYAGNFTQWKKVNSSNGYFYLQNRQTNHYFRPNTDVTNSTMVQRPTSYAGNYTQWKFEAVSGGTTPNPDPTPTPTPATGIPFNKVIGIQPVIASWISTTEKFDYISARFNENGVIKSPKIPNSQALRSLLEWESFIVEDGGNGNVRVKVKNFGAGYKYLVVSGTSVSATGESATAAAAQFTWETVGNASAKRFGLKSVATGKYLQIPQNQNGEITLNVDGAQRGAWELFQYEEKASAKNLNIEVKTSIYPNPTASGINVAINESSVGGSIEIYSLKGALFSSTTTTRTETYIELPVASGVYIVKLIKDGKELSNSKVVKN